MGLLMKTVLLISLIAFVSAADKKVDKKADPPAQVETLDLEKFDGSLPKKCQTSADDMKVKAIPFSNTRGEVLGVEFMEVKEGSFWERAQLKKSDVVMALNGRGLKDPVSMLEALHALKAGANKWKLQRGGKTETVTFSCE